MSDTKPGVFPASSLPQPGGPLLRLFSGACSSRQGTCGGDASSGQSLADIAARPHIGIDEAGRGCLAGPVVASAVLFPPGYDHKERLPGLDDSKKLSEKKRSALAGLIAAESLAYGVGLAWQDEVDAVNILNATFRAMSRAVLALACRMQEAGRREALPPLCVDGNHAIPEEQWRECACGVPASALAWEQYLPLPVTVLPSRSPQLPVQYPIIDGDALLPSISAASILAKTIRDGLMGRLADFYPGYGFERHKGYGTKAHLAALEVKGPCQLHRKTFRKVRADKAQLELKTGMDSR